ncbi:hypothetical protein HELRODRAFT_194550 [Helobdella robusta]|uniref:E3 SUMO-protein ligase NSE2 n=1 Tax=Helobdella robusta TaxID=6412 RepID=T1FW67_HELRO|nr:hypothetical protein HELRODRAFT_194550 [Helobdella robusta]ESN91103.1 hypothetical protein HELRODRAFT_194550 [Helobdella robusta]
MQVQTSHYSMDPKRIRLDVNQAQAARSIISSQHGNGAIVTPDTLFVNVNNQAFPILGSSSNGTSNLTSTTMQSLNNINNSTTSRQHFASSVPTLRLKNITEISAEQQRLMNSNSSRQALNNITLKNQLLNIPISTTTPKCTSVSVARAVSIAPNISVSKAVQQAVVLPTYNLQPPPPPFSNNVARLSSSNLMPPSGFTYAGPGQSVSIPALQIRIGSKKYKPVSNVTFKDDGILFTLKDYTYAPVLLNARAIVKCKANLSTFSYPALFLFLESSCMRQIRSIFNITHKEFNLSSPVELKQCITIFPLFGVDGKSQSQQVMQSIKMSFGAMLKRYPRSCPILEEISNDQVIDILLMNQVDKPDNPDPSATTTAVAAAATTTASVTTNANANSSNSNNNNVINVSNNDNSSHGNNNGNGNTANGDVTHVSNQASDNRNSNVPNAEYHHLAKSNNQPSTASQQQQQQQLPVINANQAGIPAGAATLVIPNDQTEWQNMQKNLMVGGLYHAQVPSGQRKYCLWNGTQLVPCLVQNTEVQLACSHLRFGLCLISCVGQVRIRSDQSCGIYFTVRGKDGKLAEVSLSYSDIVNCQLLSSQKSAAIVLSLSVGMVEKLRDQLKIGSDAGGPLFAPNITARKYLIIFLSDINKDQEEAMVNMKSNLPNGNKKKTQMFPKLDDRTAISSLIEIACNMTPDDAKEIMTKYSLKTQDNLDKLFQLISTKELIIDPSEFSDASLVDDDDDDIIMTSEELGVKCPYTQKVMEEPVKNTKCGHNYEKKAILEFINNKKGNAKCPYAGCGNREPLKVEDLEDNLTLKEYITNLNNSPNKT